MSKELGKVDDGRLRAGQCGNGMGRIAQELPSSANGAQADSATARKRQAPIGCFGRCDPSEMGALHDWFLAGNTDGKEDVIRGLLHWLINLLTERFRDADRALIVDAVNDAFIFYWRDPQTYKSFLGVPLNSYLLRAARCNVLDGLDREKRHRRRQELATTIYFENLVELRPSAPNILVED
jgi:hypothetical protein